jgi:hypothetical protein
MPIKWNEPAVYPLIRHLGDGIWGALCERCSDRIEGPSIGSVVSNHSVHVTRKHNERED